MHYVTTVLVVKLYSIGLLCSRANRVYTDVVDCALSGTCGDYMYTVCIGSRLEFLNEMLLIAEMLKEGFGDG